MKIYLRGHDYQFATQQIYMCLFPNSHAEFTDTLPSDGDYAVSSLELHDTMMFSETTIFLSGKSTCGKAEFPFSETDTEEDIKRTAKRAVKTSFYEAALPHLGKRPPWGALTGIRPSKVAAAYIKDGMSVEDTAKAMERDYFVTYERAKLAAVCAKRAERMAQGTDSRDMSLYVGIPFCASRCKYCSFVSHSIENARHLVSPYLEMLATELSKLGKSAHEAGLRLRSIYIGGGTPTALDASELDFVMKKIAENFPVCDAAEYTVEGGRPDTLTAEKIRVIRENGATRISVNPQTMNNKILEEMDRRHTAEDVVRAIEDVRRVGGLIINTDLIAGLPNDSFESFKNSVDRMIQLSPENITVHTLALKKGSELRREKYILPDGEQTERMVEYAMSELWKHGFLPYYLYRQKYMSGNLENVGYSKPGYESDYNNYIMDELHTILSAGAGGVTKLIDRENARIERIFNPKYPYEYNNAEEKIESTQKKLLEFFGC